MSLSNGDFGAAKSLFLKKLTSIKFFGQEMEYFTQTSINELATRENILKMLSREDHADAIISKAKKLFVLFVFAEIPVYQLGNFVIDHKGADENLPYSSTECPAGFNNNIFQTIIQYQNNVEPVYFKEGQFNDRVDGTCQIPISTSVESMLGSGDGGEVSVCEIENCHHNFASSSDTFAIKRIKDKASAEREKAFLYLLEEIKHNHITRFYTAFEYDQKTYLIAEKAEGDLLALFGQRPVYLNQQWLITQLRGLAEALVKIHNPTATLSAYHHDIKPENILVFQSPETPTLKLTDWGCAGFNKPSPNSSGSQGSNMKGIPTYCPQEAEGNKITSQPHDIWSLGCVFLEMCIWFAEGSDSLEKFNTSRAGDDDNGFWVRKDNGEVALLKLVSDKLKILSADTKITGLVTVIRAMLEINPKTRIDASTLVRHLEKVQHELHKQRIQEGGLV